MNCLICKTKLNQGKKYCSYKCYGIAQRKSIQKECPICGTYFKFPRSQLKQNRRTCSRICHFVYLRNRPFPFKGNKHWHWQGGISHQNGYIYIKNKGGLHRIKYEKKLGRKLQKWEVIHHINNIRNDNRLINLKLLTRAEHTKLHNRLKNVKYFLEKGEKK